MTVGNLLNNVLIKKRRVDKLIEIDPFDEESLQLAQYALSPKEIIYWKKEGGESQRHHLIDLGKPYEFQPHEYALAVVRERIVLSEGIVGRFIPMSGLIEKGFGLTAGKLDPNYGREGEEIRFGLYNLKNIPNSYDNKSPLAYIEFFDLRELSSTMIKKTEKEELIWLKRRLAEVE